MSPRSGAAHRAPSTALACLATLLALAVPARAQPADDEMLQRTLRQARAWVAELYSTLSGLAVEERFEQRLRTWSHQSSDRTTRADLVLLRTATTWVQFRDVFDVDGRQVSDRRERLQRLFLDHPETALSDATRLTEESSRYNLGSVQRTINVPTFGLTVLAGLPDGHFAFHVVGRARVGQVDALQLTFTEQAAHTIVTTTRGAPVPLDGQLWIDARTGRVMRSVVRTRGTAGDDDRLTRVSVETEFGPVAGLGLWLPVRMRETAQGADLSVTTGTAVYSRFRRFTVTTAEAYRPVPSSP